MPASADGHRAAPAFDTWTYEGCESPPHAPPACSPQPHAQERLRAKGLLYLEEKPEYRCVLQSTAQRAAITVDSPWGTNEPSQIVFIGSAGGVDAEILGAL